jgi:Domain of unknown function (DUF3854)
VKPPPLLPHHLDQLRASAISDEVIGARGYGSVMRPTAGNSDPRAMLKRLGFPFWARDGDSRFPGLLLPLYRATGEVASWQYRPDSPPKDPKTGKPRKYASQVGRPNVVDVHPFSHDAIIDPRVRLWICEGVKKADALRSRGQCAVALAGVWNWRSALGTLGDWEDINLKGREAAVSFDADVLTNVQVRRAATRLGAWLKSKGAKPVYVCPPEIDGEQPKGLDDYFAAGGDLELLLDTASDALPPMAVPVPRQHGCPYRESHGGIVWDKPTQQGTIETPLTNFTAAITGHTVIDNGSGEERSEFEITARVAGGAERTFGVSAAQFGSMNWASKLGPEAIVNAGMSVRDHARAAVQRLSGAVPERRVHAHTGWRELPGGWGYLTASGAIRPAGLDESVTVELDGSLSRYELPDPSDLGDVREAVRASLSILGLADESVTVPLLAAVYRAPLPLPPDCTPWLRGLTGALKTALCALAQQHFGAGMDAQHLPGSWESTANRLEADAHALANVVFVVDDFRPDLGAFEARKRAAVVERLVRGVANQGSRDRLRSDTSRRPSRPPRGQVLCSAEDLPPGGVSLRARTMISQVVKAPAEGAVDLGKLSVAQTAGSDGVFALAMAGYVQFLAASFPALPANCKTWFTRFRDAARSGGHLRNAANVASLALGWHAWLHFAYQAGAIGKDEHDCLWQRTWKALADLAAEQSRYQEDANPILVYLRALNALISSGHAHLSTVAGRCPGESTSAGDPSSPDESQRWGWAQDSYLGWRGQGQRLGWLDDSGDVYLDPDVSHRAARQWTEQAGTPLGVSKAQLHDDMKERGVLASSDPGRTTVRRDVSGVRSKRVLHLSAYQFENYGQ